jgi:hypothetical protein
MKNVDLGKKMEYNKDTLPVVLRADYAGGASCPGFP